jgi:hypothetical protein
MGPVSDPFLRKQSNYIVTITVTIAVFTTQQCRVSGVRQQHVLVKRDIKSNCLRRKTFVHFIFLDMVAVNTMRLRFVQIQ